MDYVAAGLIMYSDEYRSGRSTKSIVIKQNRLSKLVDWFIESEVVNQRKIPTGSVLRGRQCVLQPAAHCEPPGVEGPGQ